MAEKADALVFPHFAFDYPGAMVTGTFYLSITDTSQWLMKICDLRFAGQAGIQKVLLCVSGYGPAFTHDIILPKYGDALPK